jgi:LysM repeat protein
MRTWIQSACLLLAVSIVPVSLVAAGGQGPVHPAQASIRTHRQTARPPVLILTGTVSTAVVAAAAASSPARYAVQPGDTLSGIAARFGVRGGWPALYAANRPRVGPSPDLLQAGTVLVLPGVAVPARYAVAAGDTLAAIAAGLGVPGGWPALYAANRQVIGPSPDTIHPGTVLTVPHAGAPAPSAPVTGPQPPHPAPSPPAPHRPGHHPRPVTKPAPTTTGMPAWLTFMLLAVGLLIALVFLAEAILAIRRRRQRAALARAVQLRRAETGAGPGSRPWHILLADHERLVVTRNKRDDTICVLRPPGEDPRAILRVARLVLPEEPYGELARHLRVPTGWPMT